MDKIIIPNPDRPSAVPLRAIPTAQTRLIALLGDPVAHSLSPTFQNAAFQVSGLDAIYLALRTDADTLPGLLLGIARAGGGGNLTVPYKELAAEIVEWRTPAVEWTGACNTFWLEDGRVCGDNTDLAGFRAAIQALTGPLTGARVLILGAGGAARAAVAALLDDGVDAIDILNRTPSRALELVDAISTAAPTGLDPRQLIEVLTTEATLQRERYDLVVNATSLGLNADDPLPLSLDEVGEVGAALDLVYAPGETRWVQEARQVGIRAADGIEMLIHQGAAAFERWWGEAAPIDLMRAALP